MQHFICVCGAGAEELCQQVLQQPDGGQVPDRRHQRSPARQPLPPPQSFRKFPLHAIWTDLHLFKQ